MTMPGSGVRVHAQAFGAALFPIVAAFGTNSVHFAHGARRHGNAHVRPGVRAHAAAALPEKAATESHSDATHALRQCGQVRYASRGGGRRPALHADSNVMRT